MRSNHYGNSLISTLTIREKTILSMVLKLCSKPSIPFTDEAFLYTKRISRVLILILLIKPSQ